MSAMTGNDMGGLFTRLRGNDPGKLDIRCDVCGEPLYMTCEIEGRSGKETYIVHRQCACRRKEYAENAEHQRRNDIEAERDKALPNAAARRCRFDNSQDNMNLKAVRMYAEKFDEVAKHERTGLMLWGSVGTGKTHAAYCLANALIDNGVKVYLTSIAALADATFHDQEDRNYVMGRVKGCGLLILDDVGAERETSFMAEKAFMFIDERVKTGKPLVITTNVSPKEMDTTQDTTKKRIYDRIRGNTVAIAFNGESRRHASIEENAKRLREIIRG